MDLASCVCRHQGSSMVQVQTCLSTAGQSLKVSSPQYSRGFSCLIVGDTSFPSKFLPSTLKSKRALSIFNPRGFQPVPRCSKSFSRNDGPGLLLASRDTRLGCGFSCALATGQDAQRSQLLRRQRRKRGDWQRRRKRRRRRKPRRRFRRERLPRHWGRRRRRWGRL